MKLKLKFYEKILNGEKKKEFRIEKMNLAEKEYEKLKNNKNINLNQLASYHLAERDYTVLDFGDNKYYLLRKAWSIGTAEAANAYLEEYKNSIDLDSYIYCKHVLIPKMKEDKDLVFVIYSIYKSKIENVTITF